MPPSDPIEPSGREHIAGRVSSDRLATTALAWLARARSDIILGEPAAPTYRGGDPLPSVEIIDLAVSDIECLSMPLDPAELELARLSALAGVRDASPGHSRLVTIFSPGAFECWGAAYATGFTKTTRGAVSLEAADGSVAHGQHYRWEGLPYELDAVRAHVSSSGRRQTVYSWPEGPAPSLSARFAYNVARSAGAEVGAAMDLSREMVAPRRLSSSQAGPTTPPDFSVLLAQ